MRNCWSRLFSSREEPKPSRKIRWGGPEPRKFDYPKEAQCYVAIYQGDDENPIESYFRSEKDSDIQKTSQSILDSYRVIISNTPEELERQIGIKIRSLGITYVFGMRISEEEVRHLINEGSGFGRNILYGINHNEISLFRHAPKVPTVKIKIWRRTDFELPQETKPLFNT